MKYKGKEFECGTVKVGERGQIVIPKSIREELEIKPGDNLNRLGKQRRRYSDNCCQQSRRIGSDSIKR